MCKEVNVKESEWSECKSFLHSWQVKIQTWMLDSPAHVTSRSSIISSLAVCLREMPFSMFTRNIAVFTFHSTWPHQAEVGSDPASPSLWKVKIVAGLDGRVVIEKGYGWSWNYMFADLDQFEMAKISLQQAGVDQRLNLEWKQFKKFFFHCIAWHGSKFSFRSLHHWNVHEIQLRIRIML